jgi:hypothetical protein
MISPTDTAYRLLPTSPSARELMDAYAPGLFELKFAEEVLAAVSPYQTSHINRFGQCNFMPGGLQIHYRSSASPQTSKSARWIRPVWPLQVNPMT